MKKIAYITDLHLKEELPHSQGVDTRKNFEQILKDVNEHQIKDIILGGDLGETEEYSWLFDKLKDKEIYITLGNHDQYKDVKDYLKIKGDVDDELYYSFSEESFKFIFLDSSSDKLSGKQLEWLEKEINTSKPLALFIHHPVLKVETYVDKKYPLFNREKVHKMLSGISNEVYIFCGHYHLKFKSEADNMTQYITPAASLQIKKNLSEFVPDSSTFGYSIITFENSDLNYQVRSYENGEFKDSQ